MAHAGPTKLTEQDTLAPHGKAYGLWFACMIVGVVGLAVGTLLALLLDGDGHGWQRFGFSYLISYSYWLAIALGCLFFVIITHLFRAGWCVMVRRVAENGAAALPVAALLAIPILLFVWSGDGKLYPWADVKWATLAEQAHAEHDNGAHPASDHDAAPAGDHGDAAHPAEHPAHAEPGHHSAAPALDTGEGPTYFVANTGEEAHPAPADGHHDAGHDINLTAPANGAPNEKMVLHFLYDHDGHLTGKGTWLQPGFFTARVVIYLAVWSAIALWYRKQSIRQDETGDKALTNDREARAPVAVIAFALTVTFGIFDLLMSLDPTWYSTIFGVYYFANAFTGGLCAIILTHMFLQRKGLVPTVNTEHFHDLGKLLFAFVFFWGYIAYSQYILIWYPSMPEIAYWFQLRGATTVESAPQYGSMWTLLAFVLLFGHLLIPFAFLLSRHVKRNRAALMGACFWMLAMIAVDLFWIVRPVLSSGIGAEDPAAAGVPFSFGELVMLVALWIGVGGIMIAAAVKMAAPASLVAKGDPRLSESLKLDTSAAAPMFDTH